MCEQTEIAYLDGEVVWVKLGSCWWPGEVVASDKLPPDVLPSFRKPPIAVVKFFDEDAYEYVKNINSIYKYNCSKKNEFIKKGLDMYRAKRGHMEKFPEDIIRAETVTGGDEDILFREEYQETKKASYAGLFGDQTKKTPASVKKGRGKAAESPKISTPFRKLNLKSDYKVHILVQGSKSPSHPTEKPCSPSTSRAGSESAEDKQKDQVSTPKPMAATPAVSSSGIYACHACNFSTTRLNVLVLHNKTHSVTPSTYTPSPIRKKPVSKSPKSKPSSSKTPKTPKAQPRKEKTDTPKKEKGIKRSAADKSSTEAKKTKTDEEIKSSLLADWDDGDDESNDESTANVMGSSPEVPIAAESPAVPTPAELPSAQVPEGQSFESKFNSESDKKPVDISDDIPEQTSDSKYDFCEDEDWHVETDVGRKIPRVKNPSARKEETKSLSIDDEEVARDVAELLDKTTMPELPSIPEPLKAEENFPEPPVVKSPDKLPKSPEQKPTEKSEIQPSKVIFKTKTFFRSRHSRSQDAIGKYVAEQLNAAERMDISDIDINGPEVTSSPEARDSPPVEPVKVAKLAPKIQLKKMKAEAAQLREKDKHIFDPFQIDTFDIKKPNDNAELPQTPEKVENTPIATNKLSLDVLYPTQEIKPINKETPEKSSPKPDKLKVYSRPEKVAIVDKQTDNKELDSIKNINNTSKEANEETTLQKSNEKSEKSNEYLSTASAVDALLSVSRESDRVTGVISNDLPEDLFEDDNKEIGTNNNINGFNDPINKDDQICKQHELLLENKNTEHLQDNQISDIIQDKQSTDNIQDNLTHGQNDIIDAKNDSETYENLIVSTEEVTEEIVENDNDLETMDDNVPSESDLQIAEALINMPATTIKIQPADHQDLPDQDDVPEPIETDGVHEETICTTEHMEVDTEHMETETNKDYELKDDNVPLEMDQDHSNESSNLRFETEQEKSENLNAAQSLVEMSELIDHQLNKVDSNTVTETNVVNINLKDKIDTNDKVEKNVTILPGKNGPNAQITNENTPRLLDKSSSKLLKILEQPSIPPKNNTMPSKHVIIPGKQKILNFDVAKDSMVKSPTKQKIIIRRTGSTKTFGSNLMDVSSDKVIISQNIVVKSSPSVSTHSIQSAPGITNDANSIIIQQKVRKIARAPSKIQKIKHHNSLVAPLTEAKILNKTPTDDTIFDINSMPIVLSEDILTPESIDKMPIVMSDANIVSTPNNAPKPPPKLIKSKQIIDRNEKIAISAKPNKPELKTLLINPNSDGNIVTTPNILSKSSKLRGAKPMLVFDKTTGKQKIIMTKPETPIKEIKQVTQPVNMIPQLSPQNPAKTDKFIILPTSNTPRTGRTQKIVIDPNTGKAHVFVAKGSEAPINVTENKPVSAKLMPPSSDSSPGNTVMIITNAQGAQSRIVLTPEHEKILFPNKQQPNSSQLKTIVHKISTNAGIVQKSVVNPMMPVKTQAVVTPQKCKTIATPIRAQTKIVPKQKTTTIAKNSAIITSKGQLIVGGRTATSTQNIAPMPEIRTAPKRIVATEPKKLMQAIQKNSSEPLIFLQKNSGAVMQLTQAQFEHLQRTGQIVQRPAAPAPVVAPVPSTDNKIVVQKSITIPAKETVIAKQRVRKSTVASHTPIKRTKKEIVLTPAPLPSLTPISNTAHTSVVSSVASTISSTYGELDNFEELLPSTAIVRATELAPQPVPPPMPVVVPPPVVSPPAALPPAPAPVSDGQLLAIPGEHFGGPPGSFYLCVEDNGTLTPIDNRPLMLENNQLVPMPEPLPVLAQPERRDILEAALANSDVFHADTPQNEAPDFRDLNANVSVNCRVSETSTTLNQPIMTPVEVPSKVDSEPAVPSTIEDGLAVIGVTPHTVPTSLELPITVTDPRIAPKTTDPLSNNNYGTTLLPSPSTEMTFVSTEECVVGPISMPLLTDDDGTGKSMPILSDDLGDRAVSSVESGVGSPSSLEEGGGWARRLLTPGSDCSDTSAEIPLQPAIQISVNELSRDT